MTLQPADYVLCGLAVAAAVTGLFRGLSGTIAFALAAASAAAAASIGWVHSAEMTDLLWVRAGGVLVVALLVFGIVRVIVKKLVNGLLAQPADALFGMASGAAIGVTVVVAWAWSGLFHEYSAFVRAVAEYVR